jgi:hypothetical protein
VPLVALSHRGELLSAIEAMERRYVGHPSTVAPATGTDHRLSKPNHNSANATSLLGIASPRVTGEKSPRIVAQNHSLFHTSPRPGRCAVGAVALVRPACLRSTSPWCRGRSSDAAGSRRFGPSCGGSGHESARRPGRGRFSAGILRAPRRRAGPCFHVERTVARRCQCARHRGAHARRALAARRRAFTSSLPRPPVQVARRVLSLPPESPHHAH